jgi:hypothetical protein
LLYSPLSLSGTSITYKLGQSCLRVH